MTEDQNQPHTYVHDGIFQRRQFIHVQHRARYANNKDITHTLIEN